jgi:hypothetical protein
MRMPTATNRETIRPSAYSRIIRELGVPRMQVIKWRLHQRSRELIATGMERMLHYFLCVLYEGK